MVDILVYGYIDSSDSQGKLSRFFNASYQIEKEGWRCTERHDMIKTELKYLGLVDDYHVYNLRMDKKQFEQENIYQDYYKNNQLIIFSNNDYQAYKADRGSLSIPWTHKCAYIRDIVSLIMEENANVEKNIKKPNDKGEYVREIRYCLPYGLTQDWTMTKFDKRTAAVVSTNQHVLYYNVDNFCYKKDTELTEWNEDTIKNSAKRLIGRSKTACISVEKQALKAKKEIKSIVINTLDIEDHFSEFDFLKIEKSPSDSQIDWRFNFKTIYSGYDKQVYLNYDTRTKLYSLSCNVGGRRSNHLFMYFEQDNMNELYAAIKGIIYALRYGSETQKDITEYRKEQKKAQK